MEASSKSGKGAEPAKKDHGVLYLGIDLGTSRTSVAASNGQRVTVPSFVGYPKDVVAKKLLKKEVLFGEEAIEKRLSLEFFKPLEKGVLKSGEEKDGNHRAAKDLLAEAIRRARPRKDELIYAVIGAPAQASIHSKNAILSIARGVADAVMLCSEPFAVAYGQEMLEDVLVIDIGAGTVDLCRMHGTMPEDADQLTFETAGDYVDAQLMRLIGESHPTAQFTVGMIRHIKERHSTVSDESSPIVVNLPVNGKPTPFDITREMKEACRSIVPTIVGGLEQLIATFDPEFQERLKNRVLLAGGGSRIQGLDTAIEKEMEARLGSGKVIHIEEPMYGGANGALKIAHDMPAEYWQQLS